MAAGPARATIRCMYIVHGTRSIIVSEGCYELLRNYNYNAGGMCIL
jgi:hypothetical protein